MFNHSEFEERAASMGLQSYDLARSELEAIVARIGFKMECSPLLERSRRVLEVEPDKWSLEAEHRQCRITSPRRLDTLDGLPTHRWIEATSYTVEYSAGSGIVVSWAEKHAKGGLRLDIANAKRTIGARWQTSYASEGLMKRIRAAWNPSVVDVLSSILMDATDGETFRQWCDEFGYDVDSRSAEQTFRLCEAGGEWARRAFGRDFETARELARLF